MVNEHAASSAGEPIANEIAQWRERIAQQTAAFGEDAQLTISCRDLEHWLELAEAGMRVLETISDPLDESIPPYSPAPSGNERLDVQP